MAATAAAGAWVATDVAPTNPTTPAAVAAGGSGTTLAQARVIADRWVERRFGQPARVTDTSREDDHGARWEIEVTRRDGLEFDVYVSARGRVVKVIRSGRARPAVRPGGGATATAARARVTADRHIERRFGQPARVTDIERENDHGARWEVEVTRGDGVEFDVYVNARNRVVKVVRESDDD